MSQEDAQSLGRDARVQDEQPFPEGPQTPPKEKPKERYRAKIAGPDTQEDSDTSDQEHDVLRTKRFNFHGVGSV